MSPDPLFRLLRPAVRGLRHLAVGLLALVILFEEWGWEPLQRALRWLSRLPAMRRVEAAIARLPPPAALAVLLLPTLGLLPVKLAALWLIGTGQALAGLVVVVVAKLIGTAVLAWLFSADAAGADADGVVRCGIPAVVRLEGGAAGPGPRVLGLAHRPCGQAIAAALGAVAAPLSTVARCRPTAATYDLPR